MPVEDIQGQGTPFATGTLEARKAGPGWSVVVVQALMFLVMVAWTWYYMPTYEQKIRDSFERDLVYAMASGKAKTVGRFFLQQNAAGQTVITFDVELGFNKSKGGK